MPDPLNILKSTFGYDEFRPKQEEIIERITSGNNALVLMPTGGGKSLCYQIPALVRPGTGIVVSPLISLMRDQVEGLKQLGIQAEFLNSSLNYTQRMDVEERLRANRLDLLYVAPERLFMADFQNLLETVNIALFAIDEAHCISQWGHDFRAEYLQLSEIRQKFPDIPCIAATATADAPTRKEILERLHLGSEDLFSTGFDRPNIRYSVILKNNVKQQLLRFIETDHAGDAGIVYCLTRKRTEEFASWLTEQGHQAVPYHAGLTTEDRQAHQDRFLNEEGLIVVATVAFGMGIDKPNVRFVAHLDLPKSPEAYYQETGRSGRDGLPANAWLAYSLADVVLLKRIMESSEADEQHRWTEQHKLNAIVGYCESVSCRRSILLNFFGESSPSECGNCDTCLQPVQTWDGTVVAQKALSCVARTGQRFGAGHVIDVLLGKSTEKVNRFRHHRLSTYGIGEELDKTEWSTVIRQLVAADLLSVDVSGYGSLRLTSSADSILKGESSIQLRKDPTPPSRRKPKSVPLADTLSGKPADKDLFDALRDLRLKLAREQGVPPDIIFHDRTLLTIVQHRPRNLDAFSQISGVGTVKLQRYGSAFLSVLSEHAD